ncbi:MAG: sulfite exporter TauE/SafE family protein [Candidatus Pelethousia sp.]|nr:sulfite exporter TauE/SafE family protein [Candidatus Pelethousia sp.]
MDMTYVWLVLVSLVGGFLQAAVGFGYAVFVMVFFPLFIPSIPAASTVSCLLCMLASSWMLIQYRKSVQPKKVLWPIGAYFLVMPFAILLATRIPQREMSIALGVFLLAVGIYYLFYSGKLRIPSTPAAGLITGALSGVFSGLFAVSAPPAALYCLSVMETKEAYVSTLQFFFVVTNTYALTVRAMNGLITGQVLLWSLAAAVGMSLGMLAGGLVYRRADLSRIKRWVFIFIAVMGLWTIVSNLV